MKGEPFGDVDLHAFADGELDPARVESVEAHLAAHPADAARVDGWRRQSAAIRRAFDGLESSATKRIVAGRDVRADALPAEMPRLDLVRAARRRRQAAATLAAFLGGACVALIGTVAFSRWPSPTETRFTLEPAPLAPTAQARRARLAWRTYAREIERGSDQRMPDRAAVLTALQRTTALSRIPDWSREAFELSATRVMPGESEPAAFLLYESLARTRIALIVERTPEPDAGPLLSDDGGLRCLFWRAAGYSYAIVGPAETDTIRTLARATVAAFSGR